MMESFSYSEAQYEEIPCNLCGNTNDFDVIATKDRDGFDTRTLLCNRCGLMFISPRMTKEWYDKYYEHEYRANLLKRKKGNPQLSDLDRQFASGRRFGQGLATRVAPHVRSGTIINVGSGVGGVLKGFQDVIPDLLPIGVEPSPTESAYANDHGIKTYTALFENFGEKLPRAANILSTRTLNHLLDPRQFLIRAHQQLDDGGRLILAVQNFRLAVKRFGKIIPQIDHVFMYTPETLKLFVEWAGFDILFFENPETKSFRELEDDKQRGLTSHMRLVAEKAHREPFAATVPTRGTAARVRRSMNRIYQILYHFRLRLFWRRKRLRG